MITRGGDESGFTLAELAVATALSTIIGTITMLGLNQVLTLNRVMTGRILTIDSGRSLLDQAFRQLRSARPPGACENPSGATTVESCLRVGESSTIPTVFYADDQRLCFFSYDIVVSGSTALSAPKKVCIGRPNTTTSTITRWEWDPSSADYVGAWTSTNTTVGTYPATTATRSVLIGTVSQTTPLFRYYDADNRLLCATWPTSSTVVGDTSSCTNDATSPTGSLSTVALGYVAALGVNIGLTNTAEVSGTTTYQYNSNIALRGARYKVEGTWDGGVG